MVDQTKMFKTVSNAKNIRWNHETIKCRLLDCIQYQWDIVHDEDADYRVV